MYGLVNYSHFIQKNNSSKEQISVQCTLKMSDKSADLLFR